MAEIKLPKWEGSQNTDPEVARLVKETEEKKNKQNIPTEKLAVVDKKYEVDKQVTLWESKVQSNALLQEIEKYIDKHTKRELKDIFLKSWIDWLKELASAHDKMSLNDRKQIMQKFWYSIDHSHVIAAVKIVRALENKQIDINNYFEIKQASKVQSESDRWVDKVEIKKWKIEIGEAGIYEWEYIMKEWKPIPHWEWILTHKNGNTLKWKFENWQIIKGEFIDKTTWNKFVWEFKNGIAHNWKMFDSKWTQIGEVKNWKRIMNEKQEKKPELTESERKILEKNKKYLETNKVRVDKVVKELGNEKYKNSKDTITKTLNEPNEESVKELQKLVWITDKWVDGKFWPKTMAALEKFTRIKAAAESTTEWQWKSEKKIEDTDTKRKKELDSVKSSRELDRDKADNTPKNKEEQLLKSKQEEADNIMTKSNEEWLTLFKEKKYKDAIKKFDDAITANPTNPDGYRYKWLTYEKMWSGYYREAEWMFQMAYTRDSVNKQGYYESKINSLNVMRTPGGVEYNQYKK